MVNMTETSDMLFAVARIVFARWELECDSVATRRGYREITSGAPESCHCATCRNFAATRQEIYPALVLRLFDELGIVADREAEVYHNCQVKPALHNYGGWFHFVGSIATGADASRQIALNAWTFDREKVRDRFELGFTRRIGLLHKAFQDQAVVQVEFIAMVPWVIPEPEPTPRSRRTAPLPPPRSCPARPFLPVSA
jgi:hypothetical protein